MFYLSFWTVVHNWNMNINIRFSLGQGNIHRNKDSDTEFIMSCFSLFPHEKLIAILRKLINCFAHSDYDLY